MRKIFTSLKAVVAAALVASMTLAASCSYDDSAINNRVDKVEKDLAALTERVAALEARVGEHAEALAAFADGKVVVDVKVENGNTTVTLSDGTSFVIPAPVVDTDTDTDTNTTVAPAKDADGVYYWAIYEGGEFVKFLEVENAKVPVYAEAGEGCDCVPAELKFSVDPETGNLLVSIDGGTTWVDSGVSTKAVSGACIFTDVVVNDDNTVTFVMVGGDEFTVAKAELIECEAARSSVYVIAGQTKNVAFTINDAVADINIMNQPFGWSANVVEASEVEGDNGGDAGVMPLAVGGTEYVLQINGPAQALVNAGFAAKEGVVSVHFNTAAGACKVLSVNVNLAEISLSIDKAGNITLTNSVAMEQTNHWGEVFTDFADFSIGIIDANDEAYLEYGDDVFVETYNPMMQEYFANINHTMRSSGLGNVIDLVMYEEGVCEKESYTFTPEQLAGAFWPRYNFEVGGEYIIFVTLETEQVNYATQPVLTNAIKATYKNVKVDAEFVRSTWNGAEYDLSLLGYTHYIIGWVNAMELDMYIQMGVVSSLEDYLVLSTADMGGNISVLPGTLVAGDHDGVYNLADLRAQSLTGWAPEIASNSEYYLYIYPFNFQSEMDLYAAVDPANIYSFGKFATSGLVAGEFEAGEEVEIKEYTEDLFSVIVTFNENVVAAGASFGNTPALDPDAIVDEIVSNPYDGIFTFNEEIDYLEVYTSDVTDPLYMYIVAINANGEYVFIEKEYKSGGEEPEEPEQVEQVAITSFEYVGRSYELDDNPETGGGDFVYDFTCADGTSYRMGLYWNYADAATGAINNGTYNYCYNALNAMYGGWDGFVIVSETTYFDSTLTVTEETITWRIPGKVEYVYTIGAEGGDEPEEPEVFEVSASAALVADTTFGGFNPYDVTFSFENGDKVVVRFNTGGAQYLHLGNWQSDNWQDPHYISQVKYNGEYAAITACNVAYENDAYTVTMSVFEYTNYSTLNYTYTGAIEGLIAPEACDCLTPDQPDQPEGGEEEDEDYSDVFQDGTQENPYIYKANVTPAAGYYEIRFTCDAEGGLPLYLETQNDIISSIITGPIGSACGWYSGYYNDAQTAIDLGASKITVTTISANCISLDEIALKTDAGYVYYKCPKVQF